MRFRSSAGRPDACKISARTYFWNIPPYHIRVHGREEPTNIFSLLRNMGYSTTIFYDNAGYPICLLDLDSRELEMIAEYVDAKPTLYGDLLISNNDLLARFYESDRKRFTEPAQGTGPIALG
jgi:hypothetical protein